MMQGKHLRSVFMTAPAGVRRDSSEAVGRSLASMICISNFGECEAVALLVSKGVERGQRTAQRLGHPAPFWAFPNSHP